MSFEEKMKDMPVFISFPRSGSHWLNCVMELYFDRPRLRPSRVTFLPPSRRDWMWFHDHDLSLNIDYKRLGHKNVLYLYRNPIDTIYSNLMYESFNRTRDESIYRTADFDRGHIKQVTIACFQNMYKWLFEHKAKVIIKYENFKGKNRNREFQKIIHFFGEEVREKDIDRFFAIVTKEAIVKQAKKKNVNSTAINDNLLKEYYSNNRESFREKWKDFIMKLAPKEMKNL